MQQNSTSDVLIKDGRGWPGGGRGGLSPVNSAEDRAVPRSGCFLSQGSTKAAPLFSRRSEGLILITVARLSLLLIIYFYQQIFKEARILYL